MSSIFQHTAGYLSETSGAFTLFMSVGTGAECVDYFTGKKSPLSETVQKVFFAAGSAITWPWLLSDAMEFVRDQSASVFFSLTENIANAFEYAHENQLVEFPGYIPLISTIGHVSCILADGIKIYSETNIYFSPAESEVRKNLSFIRIAEKVYSICRGILNIGVALVGLVVLPQLRLFLTVTWLVARATSNIYERAAVL